MTSGIFATWLMEGPAHGEARAIVYVPGEFHGIAMREHTDDPVVLVVAPTWEDLRVRLLSLSIESASRSRTLA